MTQAADGEHILLQTMYLMKCRFRQSFNKECKDSAVAFPPIDTHFKPQFTIKTSVSSISC